MKHLILAGLAVSTLSGCLMYEDRDFQPGVYPVSKDEVISMTKAGYSDDRILDQIHGNGVSQRASADDLVEMNSAGVSSRVLAGFTEAPVRDYQPAVETRTRYYYDLWSEPVVNYGLGVLTGYLLWRHYRHK